MDQSSLLDLPDLVRDSKLETKFHAKYTAHRYHEVDSTSSARSVIREEYWRRQRYIGSGSYGRVWLETCVKGGRNHDVRAVKEIIKSPLAQRYNYYNRELEAIAKFSHDKYVRCFVKSLGWYERNDTIYIAMEYFPLGDLSDYLIVSPAVPEDEAKEIVFQLLEGLNFLHENGFAHRDLKPGNVLVKAKPPERWWIKIGDFGISKRAATSGQASSTLKGTLGFMPPELHGFVDPADCYGDDTQAGACAADLWALGEMTFQILTKETCFKNMRILSAYVVKSDLFPSHVLREHGVSSDGNDLVKALMLPAPRMRIDASRAMAHIWVAPCRLPSPRPLSLASLGSSDNDEELFLEDDLIRAEPSARWSTVSAHRTLENEVQDWSSITTTDTSKAHVSVSQTMDNRSEVRRKPVVSNNITATVASITGSEPVLSQDLAPIPQSAKESRGTVTGPEVWFDTSSGHTTRPKSTQEAYTRLNGQNSEPRNPEKRSDSAQSSGDSTTNQALDVDFTHMAMAPASSFSGKRHPDHRTAYLTPSRSNEQSKSGSESSERSKTIVFTVSEDGGGAVMDELGHVAGYVFGDSCIKLMGKRVTPVMAGSICVDWVAAEHNDQQSAATPDAVKASLEKRDEQSFGLDLENASILARRHNDPFRKSGEQPFGLNMDNASMLARRNNNPIAKEQDTLKGASRKMRRVTLFKNNFVLDIPQDAQFLKDIPHASPPERDEFTHYRYSAITCSPSQYTREYYTLRPWQFAKRRQIDILIAINFSEWPSREKFYNLLKDVRIAFHELLTYPELVNGIKPRQVWKSVVVLFSGCHEDSGVDWLFAQLGLIQDWTSGPQAHPLEVMDGQNNRLMSVKPYEGPPPKIGAHHVTAHIYEYTTQKRILRVGEEGFTSEPAHGPMQLMVCRSVVPPLHDEVEWSHAIGSLLDARLTITYNMTKTVPQIRRTAWTSIWKSERPSGEERKIVSGSPTFASNTRNAVGKAADKMLFRR